MSAEPHATPRSPVAAPVLVLLAAALPVALAVAVAPLATRPLVVGAGLAMLGAAAGAVWVSRRFGLLGLGCAAGVLAVLAGEMSALALGGQSGRLLWADAVVALGVGVALIRGRLALELPRTPFLDRMALLTAWGLVTLLAARDPLTGVAEWKEWAVAWVAGTAALAFARDHARARGLLALVAVTGALIAAHMAWVAAHSEFGFVLCVLLKKVDLPWGRTNYLAGLLILTLPVALGLLGGAASWRARLAWLAVVAVTAAGVVLSASKGAIVALAVGLLVAFVRGGRGTRVTGAVLLALALATGAALWLGPLRQVLAYRLQASALDYSVGERMDLYRLALDAAAKHPLLGIGLNNFSVLSNRLTGVDTVPHNLELGFLAELGVVGLVLALAWVVAFGRDAWRARAAATTPRDRALAVGLWAAFLACVVHNQFESTLYGEQYKLLLVVVAAATWRLSQPAKTPLRAL